MKITKETLKQIIQEELQNLQEAGFPEDEREYYEHPDDIERGPFPAAEQGPGDSKASPLATFDRKVALMGTITDKVFAKLEETGKTAHKPKVRKLVLGEIEQLQDPPVTGPLPPQVDAAAIVKIVNKVIDDLGGGVAIDPETYGAHPLDH